MLLTRDPAMALSRGLLRYTLPLLSITLLVSIRTRAEDGRDAWLRYTPIRDEAARKRLADLPGLVVRLDDSPVATAAQQEMIRGIEGMLGRRVRAQPRLQDESAIVLGTYETLSKINASLEPDSSLKPDGYWLK